MQLHCSFVALAVLVAFTKTKGAYSLDPSLTVPSIPAVPNPNPVVPSESVSPGIRALPSPDDSEANLLAQRALGTAIIRRVTDSCTDGTVQCCAEAKYAGDSYIQQLFQEYDISSDDVAELVGVDCGDPTGNINNEDDQDSLCPGDTQVALCCKDATYGGVMSRECEDISSGDDRA